MPAREAERKGRRLVRDATAQPMSIEGEPLIADCSGALYWHAERTLLVADLHLEKGSAFAARGVPLPPYDTRDTLGRLAEAIGRWDPERVVALGDSFQDRGGAERMGADDLGMLEALQAGREWIWVAGNHDPAIGARAGGRLCAELRVGRLVLRHVPQAGEAKGEIAGHLHPAAKLAGNGAAVRRPCFVGNARRLVLPAFGAYAGGLNVLDPAFAALFGGGEMAVWVVGEEGLYPVAVETLRGD